MSLQNTKNRIFHVIEKAKSGDDASLAFDYFMMSFIILSAIAVILESYEDIRAHYAQELLFFDYVSFGVFTAEYLLRLWTADLLYPKASSSFKARLRFVFSVSAVIDFLAILPFFVPFLITTDMRMLRILRILKMLRALKLNRYSKPLMIIRDVLVEKRQELIATFFLSLFLILLASTIMYQVENADNPEQFPNIVETFWWSVVTITTVGYGDTVPKTGLGKVIASIIAYFGLMVVAIPSGIISAGFLNRLQKEQAKKELKNFKDLMYCPHCGEKLPEEFLANKKSEHEHDKKDKEEK